MTTAQSAPLRTELDAADAAFKCHISAPPAADDHGAATEAWALRALKLSRAAADALATYAENSYERGAITTDTFAATLVEAEVWHQQNERTVRWCLTELGRADAEIGW
ncbi:hypothetical protein [Kitasatospora sp. MBT66]|uniref:hypothetical protein n=1 Tax=Kitasatospora sp. MBT66 TaxID=1444769 RepID=UPI0005B7750D|nr:hypothetical protein [Kitasatospora sp. MBT66]